MKVINYTECRSCGAQFYSGQKTHLEDGDDMEIICRKIPRCSQCKFQDNNRITTSKKPREDVW